MKVIMEFNGTVKDFQDAMCAMDEEFDLFDSIFYMMDYEPDDDEVNVHRTEFGTIQLRVEDMEE